MTLTKYFLFTILFAVSAVGNAVSITVHNTGVDATDNLVAAGAQTSFWSLSSQPVGAGYTLGSNPFRYYNGAYTADSATAAWVSPSSNGSAGTGGIYTYDLVVDLTGVDTSTATISGLFSTDNDGSIYLNGGAAVATTGFGEFGGAHTPFSFTSGFVNGLNTISVNVNNGGDPTAFYVEFTRADGDPSCIPGQTCPENGVPVPAPLALLGLGLLGVGFQRWKQRR